jgi:hypothetical protein
MQNDRRYDEQEIAEILRLATETDESPSPPSAATGMTLAQIRDVAVEAGISVARIESAALSLGPAVTTPAARFLGAPRSVTRTFALDRPLSDDEWMRLVVVLRETFDARGTIESVGPLRTWYNGNLQVHVEPAEGGYRVRMSTFKGNVTERMVMGSAFLFMALLLGLTIFLKKGLDAGLIMSALFGALGLGAIGSARLALPAWAETRAAQMEAIAARIPRLLDDEAGDG